MKKGILFLLLSAFCFVTINAQEAIPFRYKNALKISPIDFAQSKFQVTYERYIKNRSQSVLMMPAVILEEDGKDTRKGVELMLQYRFFLTHLRKGLNRTLGFYDIGFYAGPYVLGLNYQEDYERSIYYPVENTSKQVIFEQEVNAFEGGVIIGVQFDITARILFDLYVGGGIRKGDVTDTYDDFENPEEYYYEPSYGVFDVEYTGVKPKLGMQLGISF